MSETPNYDVSPSEASFIDGLRQIDLDALGNGVSENPGSTESQDAGSGEEYQGNQPAAETDVFDDDSIFNYDFDLAARGIAADAGASDVSVSDGPALAEEEPLVSETVTTLYDADGNITGYSIVTTGSDGSGLSYTHTASYDASWNVTGWSYSDSSGYASSTTYETLTDADGNITGYSIVTTGSDASGSSFTYANTYDASWNVTGTSYSDSSGFASSAIYEANTDADGNFAGYTVSWTVTNADGSTYSAVYDYDASGNLIDEGSGVGDYVMVDDGSLTGDLATDPPADYSVNDIDTGPLVDDAEPSVSYGPDDLVQVEVLSDVNDLAVAREANSGFILA